MVARVHEDAAALQDTVHFGHHGGDPAHVEVLAANAGLAFEELGDVALDRILPVAHVGAVDGEFLGGAVDADVFGREHEGAGRRVKREHHDAAAEREDELGLRTVHAVACGDLLGAGHQEVLGHGLALRANGGKDREDRADGDVDVDVGGTVERVEADQVRADRQVFGNGNDLGDLFAHHAADGARKGDGLDEDVVADDVELLLVFALDVFGAGHAEHAGEGAVAHLEADRLAGFGDADDQAGENGVEVVKLLFTAEILTERKGGHDAISSYAGLFKAFSTISRTLTESFS